MRLPMLIAAVMLFAVQAAIAAESERTVVKAGEVLNEIMVTPVSKIPEVLLADAEAVAVFPGVVKVGFVAGVERGTGVVVIRGDDRNWQVPRFITITGGSVGWQIGASATDLILVFKTRKSIENLLQGKFKIGADIAAAAGPVGRRAEAATDGQLQAEIYSYSRSRGLFAGASIDGAVIQLDTEIEKEYYRPGMDGMVRLPESGAKFVALVDAYSKDSGTEAPAATAANQNPMQNPLEQLHTQAYASYGQLARIVDDNWKSYLAMPAGQPDAASLAVTLSRYEQVVRDPQYAVIAARPEFQQAYRAIADYANALANPPKEVLSLPPPPGAR